MAATETAVFRDSPSLRYRPGRWAAVRRCVQRQRAGVLQAQRPVWGGQAGCAVRQAGWKAGKGRLEGVGLGCRAG